MRESGNYGYMSTAAARPKLAIKSDADAKAAPGRDLEAVKLKAPGGRPHTALAEFEQVYRSNVDVVTAYYARRCADPQMVADLTSETFVRASQL